MDEADQALIGDTIADLDAVLRIFSSITRIAQIETQARKGGFRTVNLVEIAGEVVELYDAAAEQDGTRLTVAGDGEVLVTGDRDLIFDAIANLVDNAIKHGRAGGRGRGCQTKTSRAGRSFRSPMTGREFPPTNTSMSSSAFTGWNTAATRRETGSGLSLVAAVARLHGARIEMLDNSPGLKFRLWFSGPAG